MGRWDPPRSTRTKKRIINERKKRNIEVDLGPKRGSTRNVRRSVQSLTSKLLKREKFPAWIWFQQ